MELYKIYEYVLINGSKEKTWKTIARSRNRTLEDGPLYEFASHPRAVMLSSLHHSNCGP